MSQLSVGAIMKPGSLEVDVDKLTYYIQNYYIGSFFDTPLSGGDLYGASAWSPSDWQAFIKTIQDIALASDPKIPILYGLDSVHGANYVRGATIFPQQINAAASFNVDLVMKMGAIQGKDTRACGIPWAFSPILGVMLESNWPRVYETFGEDPYLIGEMGAAIIKGMQGYPADISNQTRVAACMKHFIGYPVAESGQDRAPSWIPDRFLYQYFVPPFQKAVDAQVATTMEAYCEINGSPIAASKQYLKILLRDQMKFNGVLVTDFNEINNLNSWHFVAESRKEAVRLSINRTTIDMSMVPYDEMFSVQLLELVEDGFISQERIDTSAGRILQLKKDLGLFHNAYGPIDPEVANRVGSNDDHYAALQAARESIVMTKNDNGFLPLDGTKALKVLLSGPSCDSKRLQSGGWTVHWQGADSEYDFTHGWTVKQFLDLLAYQTYPNLTLKEAPGCYFDTPCNAEDYADAVAAAQWADVVVHCTGEHTYTEKPGNINDAAMDAGQVRFATAMMQTGKPVVLVLFIGRPRLLNGLAEMATAVFVGGLPGPEGGRAIGEMLFGMVNPSAKLPYTYQKYPNNFNFAPYWHKKSRDDTYSPQWAFGAGLSFTSFTYSNLVLDKTVVQPQDTLGISVTVANTGKYQGQEVVLVYISDIYRTITPEVKMLRRFKKVSLDVGQQVQLQFSIQLWELGFYDEDLRFKLENGEFLITVGGLETRFNLTQAQLSETFETMQAASLSEVVDLDPPIGPISTASLGTPILAVCFFAFSLVSLVLTVLHKWQKGVGDWYTGFDTDSTLH